MKVALFWLAAIGGEDAAADLTAFLATRRTLALEKHFCPGGAGQPAGWSVWVTYEEGQLTAGRTSASGSKSQIDYRQILDAETFRIFSGLRVWRKTAAAAASTELFQVASNEQLADVALRRLDTMEGLKAVAGFGAGRLEKFGEALAAEVGRLIREGAEKKGGTSGAVPLSVLLDEADGRGGTAG